MFSSRARYVCVLVAGVAFLAGCARSQSSPPVPAAAAAQPAAAAPQPPAQPSKTAPVAPPAQPAASLAAKTGDPAQIDREALAAKIREQAIRRAATQPAPPTAKSSPKVEPAAPVQPGTRTEVPPEALRSTRTAQAAPPAESAAPVIKAALTAADVPPVASQPAADGGCHAPATAGLPPPPEGEPQPKFHCEQTKQVLDNIWKGQPAKYTFTFENRGEGPLRVLLKKK